MRKILLLSIVGLLLFTGCGTKKSNTNKDNSSKSTAEVVGKLEVEGRGKVELKEAKFILKLENNTGKVLDEVVCKLIFYKDDKQVFSTNIIANKVGKTYKYEHVGFEETTEFHPTWDDFDKTKVKIISYK